MRGEPNNDTRRGPRPDARMWKEHHNNKKESESQYMGV